MNRILAILITAFWIVMWAILVRTELEPQNAALREVPADRVLKLFFRHQQQTDLFLHGEGGRLGHVRIHPHVREADGQRIVDFSGNLQLQMPGGTRQRFGWQGVAHLSDKLSLERLRLETVAREASAPQSRESTARIDYESSSKLVSYEVSIGGIMVDKHQFTADENGVKELVARSGIDPQIMQFAAVNAKTTSAGVTARRSTLALKGEKVDTLQVDFEMNRQTLLKFHVSQLGQILEAETITGWTLKSD
jgi:hypothetical protein